jgi:hypothetical protein
LGLRLAMERDSPLAVSVGCGDTDGTPFALSVALATRSKGERVLGLT